MATPTVSSDFIKLLEENLREVTEDGYDEVPEQRKTFYNEIPSDNAWEQFFEISGLPDVPEFSNKLTFYGQFPGYLYRLEPKEFAMGVQFERKLLDDKKYSVMNDQGKMMGKSVARTMEKYGSYVFTRAFSASFDFLYSEEGVSLCSTAHTNKTGSSTSSGFSNSGTSALSPTSFASTRLTMRRFRNDMAERIDVNPDMIIVPDALYDRAMEIVKTPSGLDSAEGTINVQSQRPWKVVSYMRLDDADTNNWFMADSSLMKQHLLWINRIPPEYKMNFDFQTFFTQWSVYFRIACGFTSWRWIYGNNVS